MVKTWCSHLSGLGSFPSQGSTPPVFDCHAMAAACCCDAESWATGITNSSRVTRGGQVQWSFQTKVDWEEGPPGRSLPKKLAMKTL